MKTHTTENQIHQYGWEVETDTDYKPHWSTNPLVIYRADQHGFKTLWRRSVEAVLRDVEAICKARKDLPKHVPF